MHKANSFEIISFYKFINLSNPKQLKYKLVNFLEVEKFKGTIIIANEGLNGTISCKIGNGEKFISFLEKITNHKFEIKLHYHISHPFLRLKVKIKDEIIRLGKNNISPAIKTGTYVDAKKWDDLISDPEVISIDTRNVYESEIGTFKNSLKSNTKNFTDFPKWFGKNKKLMKNKKIAMFCTGGVRCEKASAYLIKQGYNRVFQLDGGIISYLKETKNKNKKWTGECFVFDERVTLDDNLTKGKYDQCYACGSAINDLDKKSPEFKMGVYCPKCKELTSNKQKKGFEERKKQIFLAKKRGLNHLGN